MPSRTASARSPSLAIRAHRAHLPGPVRGRTGHSAGDLGIVAARIKRAERRPKGWDLRLSRVRVELTVADIAAVEPQFPGPGRFVSEGT
jgi:hypothetical protein